jgi:hypothetical protein
MNGKTGGRAPIAKKVDAYSLEGEFLKTFDCIKDAADSIGRSESGISWESKNKWRIYMET